MTGVNILMNQKTLSICLLLLCVAGCKTRQQFKFEITKAADGSFVAQLPKGQWYDTGVVLASNKQLDAEITGNSARESFLVRVGNIPDASAGITKDACCGISITIPDTIKDAHVFLRLPDTAKADVLQVKLSVGDPKGP
jgi:hypothetical protein